MGVNSDFSKSLFIKEILEAAGLLSVRGWAERNAGNISCIIPHAEAVKFFDINQVKKSFDLDMNVNELAGKIFLVTATGTYFRKLHYNPARGLGVVRVSEDGGRLELIWGFEGDNSPTNEMRMHLMGHTARLKADPNHKVIMHTHATNTIVMSTMSNLDERAFTSSLWRMHSECIILFPDGIGLIPWMVPGTHEISTATAEKLAEFRLVVWPLHGLIGTGSSIDEAVGLIETVEKTAEIYVRSMRLTGSPSVLTDKQLIAIAEHFNVMPRKGII